MGFSAPVSVERIVTRRLLLRELRLGDFEGYAEHMADPIATEHLGPGPTDRRRAWSNFSSLTGGWMLTGAGWWAIEVRETGEFVGLVGNFFRELSLPLGPDANLELGWNILRPFWRRGFAKEAAAAALAFGFARHRVPRVIAHINTANVASIAVSKAIGMTFDREVDFYGFQLSRYAIERSVGRPPDSAHVSEQVQVK